MDIIIGATPAFGETLPPKSTVQDNSGMIEAKLLHVRPPRRGIAGPSGMERRGNKSKDPLKGRVLTVMVPDMDALPKDIESSDYRVLIRFTKK